jgi:hypothetical protein
MKVTFDQHIGIFEEAIPKEFCNEIISIFNSNQNYQINRQDSEGEVHPLFKSDNHLTEDVDVSKYFNFFNKNFWDKIYPLYETKYNVDASPNPYPKFISDFKIQKTNPTEGYHIWHHEVNPTCLNRIISYTVYLNNVEEGGETEFLYQSIRVKPKQGTVILWPAGYTHIHRGNPPLSGTKYIITGWIEFSENNPRYSNE